MENSEKFSPAEVHEVSEGGNIFQQGDSVGFVPHTDSEVTRQGASSTASWILGKKVHLKEVVICLVIYGFESASLFIAGDTFFFCMSLNKINTAPCMLQSSYCETVHPCIITVGSYLIALYHSSTG